MKTANILYTLFLMLFVVILLFLSIGYDRETALFPLLVSGATLALGLAALVTEFMPKLGRLAESDLFRVASDKEKNVKKEVESINFRNLSFTVSWIILLVLLVFCIGFLISLPLWVGCYIRFQGKRPWAYALMTALILWVFIYGFFLKIMGLELFQGILFGNTIS